MIRLFDGRKAFGLALAALVVLSIAQASSPSGGKPPGGKADGRGFGPSLRDILQIHGPTLLTSVPAVQKELELTEEQLKRLQEQSATLEERRGQVWYEVMAAHKGRLDVDAMAARTADLVRQHTADTAKVLSPAQMRRLWEITLQVEGPMAVRYVEVQDKLYLSPSQRLEIAKIQGALRDAEKAARDKQIGMHSDFLEVNKQKEAKKKVTDFVAEKKKDLVRLEDEIERARKDAVERVKRVLTRKQQANFDRMLGEPFELDAILKPGSARPGAFDEKKDGR